MSLSLPLRACFVSWFLGDVQILSLSSESSEWRSQILSA